MKEVSRQLAFVVFTAALFTFMGQTAKVSAQRANEIRYSALSDYVNDWDNRRDGERLIVSQVPLPREISFEKSYKMYLFKPDDNTDVGNSFYTSAALTKLFRPYLGSATDSLRVSCTLIQFAGEFDVFRSPFATRVEGLDENGKVLWAAAGPPPVRLKFRQ